MENKEFIFYANATTEQIVEKLQTSSAGLSPQEAQQRLITYGPNQLHQTEACRFPEVKKIGHKICPIK
jgi:hypothetical protein